MVCQHKLAQGRILISRRRIYYLIADTSRTISETFQFHRTRCHVSDELLTEVHPSIYLRYGGLRHKSWDKP